MTIRRLYFIILLCSFICQDFAFGQVKAIQFVNPSFEDYPRANEVPVGWRDCGFPNESPADTHPSGGFDVVKLPSDGNTYLGMVVRDNDTWERVSQLLDSPIRGGVCYGFNLNLCRSELYRSYSRTTEQRANYVRPVKLIIWGGDSYCSKKERLAESPIVSNTTWQTYAFKFEPKQTHTHIMLEAFYETPVLFPYNGNILVDKASEIAPMPCDEEPKILHIPEVVLTNLDEQPKRISKNRFNIVGFVKNIDHKRDINLSINGRRTSNFTFDKKSGTISARLTKLRKGENEVVLGATNKSGTTSADGVLIYEPEEAIAYQEPPQQPQLYDTPSERSVVQPSTTIPPPPPARKSRKIEGFTRNEITKGQVIKISSLSFKMNDSKINPSAYDKLDEIYEFLKENQEVVIEIGGHTSGLCDDEFCNELSSARAKEVALYLKNQGIPESQLSHKGYGKTKPIASNKTTTGRRRNQRVEIKILSTDG